MMKTQLLLFLLFAASFLPAKAQTYQPSAVAPGVQGQQIRHFPPLGAVLHVGNRRMDHDEQEPEL